uniref:Uncharacterized protein n=1 Tax=Arundo donax TaxID=35708 RepID=A0A0A9UA86_ARUDO
MVFDLVFE